MNVFVIDYWGLGDSVNVISAFNSFDLSACKVVVLCRGKACSELWSLQSDKKNVNILCVDKSVRGFWLLLKAAFQADVCVFSHPYHPLKRKMARLIFFKARIFWLSHDGKAFHYFFNFFSPTGQSPTLEGVLKLGLQSVFPVKRFKLPPSQSKSQPDKSNVTHKWLVAFGSDPNAKTKRFRTSELLELAKAFHGVTFLVGPDEKDLTSFLTGPLGLSVVEVGNLIELRHTLSQTESVLTVDNFVANYASRFSDAKVFVFDRKRNAEKYISSSKRCKIYNGQFKEYVDAVKYESNMRN